jgi:hypothetical protein
MPRIGYVLVAWLAAGSAHAADKTLSCSGPCRFEQRTVTKMVWPGSIFAHPRRVKEWVKVETAPRPQQHRSNDQASVPRWLDEVRQERDRDSHLSCGGRTCSDY